MNLRFGNHAAFSEAVKEDLPAVMPLWKDSTPPVGLMETGDAPLIIDKDSREQLNVTIQLAMVATRRSIIIGSALCKNNPLVVDNNNRASACYFLTAPINKFDEYIDVTAGYRVSDEYAPTEVTANGKGFEFVLPPIKNTSGKDVRSIVWVDESEGKQKAKLIIGENASVKVGDESKEIYFQALANS